MLISNKFMSNILKIESDEISLSVSSVEQAKLAIKQLKLKKKEFNLIKKQVDQQQKQLRAEYTDSVRRQGSKFSGGGGFGKFIRAFQTASRDSHRRSLADSLEPLEQKKQKIISVIDAIEHAILQVELYIIEKS